MQKLENIVREWEKDEQNILAFLASYSGNKLFLTNYSLGEVALISRTAHLGKYQWLTLIKKWINSQTVTKIIKNSPEY
ncbi:TPA: hypothetical protein ACVW80_003646 [Bacillus thuringiensis]